MLNVGFIFPSSEYLYNPFKGDPHTHFQILTVLDDYFNNKINTKLIDLRGVKKELAIYRIPECDMYLHSVYTLDYYEQTSIVKNLREKYPKAKHIAGGPYVNIFKEESLGVFDSLVLGDGEKSIIQAMKDFERLDLKKVYEQQGVIDINNYPYPKRHYLPEASVARKGVMSLKNEEKNKDLEGMLGTTAVFSRGCTNSCHFCAMPEVRKYNPRIRYKNPELIKKELEYLKKEYSIGVISLLDEIGIPSNREKAIPYLEAIANSGISWRGQCRVDGITPEIAKLAKESKCMALGLGFESISQKALNIMNKKISVEKAKETIGILKKNEIESRVYLILGLPGEPKDIVKKTWNFVEETNPDLVVLSLFTVRPGTEVFNNPKKFGIKSINTDWSKTMHLYGRYEKEKPNLTFEYEKNTSWGESMSGEEIINNYLELQNKLIENNLT